MSIPIRNADKSNAIANERTFFVTTSTWGKCGILQTDRSAKLLLDVLYHYRKEREISSSRICDYAGPHSFADHCRRGDDCGKSHSVDQGWLFVSRGTRAWISRAGVAERVFGDSSARSDGLCGNTRIYSRESG